MSVLEILKVPDPRLKEMSESVEQFDSALWDFIQDLEETMRAGPGGVGIAAAQVGVLKRIAIVDVSSRPKTKNHGRLVLINPEISEWSGMKMGREGCLSVPDYTGNVIRAEQVSLKAYDEFGKPYELESSGYEARAIQHELDHLDGLVFLDRLVSRRSDLFKRKVYK